jgi:YfiH family protein
MIIPQWPAPDNVKALATEREVFVAPEYQNPLGQSLSPYHAFNLGDHVDDLPSHVASNRQQLVNYAQGCDQVRWLQQIHGTECPNANLIVDGTQADATFTQTPGLACAVMTADCLPVLLCDLQGRHIASAHAGWRGLANGVLANTLKTFTDKGIAANQVIAWLGPAISQMAFEVGPEVKQAFSCFDDGSAWADELCFAKGARDRVHADLYRLATLQLEYLGINGVYGGGTEDINYCTASDKTEHGEYQFFSYRRQAVTGRQATLIWLANK